MIVMKKLLICDEIVSSVGLATNVLLSHRYPSKDKMPLLRYLCYQLYTSNAMINVSKETIESQNYGDVPM